MALVLLGRHLRNTVESRVTLLATCLVDVISDRRRTHAEFLPDRIQRRPGAVFLDELLDLVGAELASPGFLVVPGSGVIEPQ
jgi:hypothetical protein